MTSKTDDGTNDYLQPLLRRIARDFRGVTYHPDDPNVTVIETNARQLGLTLMPSERVRPRTVRGCTPEYSTPGATALEAMIGAVVAVGTLPRTGTISPAEADRNRKYAGDLVTYLAAAGWTLVRG